MDQLNQSFMYSQILKEILIIIDFDQQNILEFTAYCREHFSSGNIVLKSIDKLEQEYNSHMPIWWYTYPCFLYSMLNQALRTMKVDIIIKIGFFLRDLHQNTAQLHKEQYVGEKGGLMSFNSFLSTSHDRIVSFAFAESNQNDPDLIGVFFEIIIDPSTPSTPFANICDDSYH